MIMMRSLFAFAFGLALVLTSLLILSLNANNFVLGSVNYKLGIVLALNVNATTDFFNFRYYYSITKALSDINNGLIKLNPPLPPNVSISTVADSTMLTAVGSSRATLECILNEQVIGIIGPFISVEAPPAATLGSTYDVPVVSGSAGTNQVSDKTQVPYFIRSRAVDTAIVEPLLTFFTYMQWQKICLLSTTDTYGTSMASAFLSATLTGDNSFKIISSLFDNSGSLEEQIILAANSWTILIEAGCRVVIVHVANDACIAALQTAANMTLLDNPEFTLIGTADWPPIFTYIPGYNTMKMRGFLGIVMSDPDTQSWSEFKNNRSTAESAILGLSIAPVTLYEGIYYDTLIYYVQSIAHLLNYYLYDIEKLTQADINRGDQMITNMVRIDLLNALQTINFTEGVTGPFIFDQNYDRLMNFTIINWQSNESPVYTNIMKYDPVTKSLTQIDKTVDFIFAGQSSSTDPNSGYAPSDGVTIRIGDAIVTSLNVSMMLLSFVIGIVVIWTTVLLIEFAVYEKDQNQSQNYYRIKNFIKWSVLCGLIFGLGIWSMLIIGILSINFAQASIQNDQFSLLYVMLSILPIIIYSILGMGMSIKGQKYNRKLKEIDESNYFSSHTHTNTQNTHTDAQTNREKDHDSKYFHDQEQQQKIIIDKPIDAKHNTNNNNNNNNMNNNKNAEKTIILPGAVPNSNSTHTDLSQQKNQTVKIEGLSSVIVGNCNFYFIGASFMISMATLSSIWLINNSFPGNAKINLVITWQGIICAILWTWPIFLLGLMMMFYFFPKVQGLRNVTALILNLAPYILMIIDFSGHSWTYQPYTTTLSRSHVSSSNLILVLAILATIITLFALSASVNWMKLSRNSLDLVITKLKRDLDELKVNAKNEKSMKEKYMKILELINFCRPVPIPIPLTTNNIAINSNSGINSISSKNTNINNINNSDKSDNGNGNMNSLDNMPLNHDLWLYLSKNQGQQAQQKPGSGQETKAQSQSQFQLGDIMNHPICLELFKDAAKTEKTVENIMCCLEIKKFRECDDPQKRAIIGMNIYEIYIEPSDGNSNNINISGILRKKYTDLFSKSLLKNSIIHESNVFDPIHTELFILLNSNNMFNFMKTDDYKLCCWLLTHPIYSQFKI